jgi:hypothetical protein
MIERSVNPGEGSSRSRKMRPSVFCKIGPRFRADPCECCGSEWVHYREQMPMESLLLHKRTEDMPVMFKEVKRYEATSFGSLSGVIDSGSLV